jgi:Major intrinsic protein
MNTMTQRLGAEFLGTFWLVFGGCGSAVLAAAFPQLGIGFTGVALAFGLTVVTMAMPSAIYLARTSTLRSPSVCGPVTVFRRLTSFLISSCRFWAGSPPLPFST